MSEDRGLTPILECRQPAVIAENLADMQERVLAVTQIVRDLPRDSSSLPTVRQARAELRKYYASLETQRKLVKAAVMKPYLDAEAAYKKLVSTPIEEADELCRSFVEDVEADAKQKCEAGLREYFAELCGTKGIHWLPYERAGIRVTMEMAAQQEPKKAKRQLLEFVERVDQDLKVISGMENAGDILLEYEQTLDVSAALSRVQARRKTMEIVENNRAAWAKMQEAGRRNMQNIAAMAPEAVQVIQQTQEKKYRTTFTVTATTPMLRGLKTFLDGHGYEYQEESKE